MKGCLEAMASPHAILKEAQKAARTGHWQPPNNHQITLEDVINAAENGEKVLQEIFTSAGTILGQRIADLTRILDPETIIITGKSNLAKDMLFAPLAQAMRTCNSKIFRTTPKLVISPWQEENYARGAGVLVLQKLHQNCAI